MEYISFLFLCVFLPISIILHFLAKKYLALKYQNIVLLTCSYYFYASFQWFYIVLLLISSSFDYFITKKIAATTNNAHRKLWLITSISLNMGLLFTCKVFLNFENIFSVNYLLIPPGISFYTFQTLSYTIDCYRREYKPCKNIIDYLAYISFFPQLLAGPIERANKLATQLETKATVNRLEIKYGFFLILLGIFKKSVICDNLSTITTHVIKTGLQNNPICLIANYFHIIIDFSSYLDIARGLGYLFGIRLTQNILYPTFSKSPSEFWQNWHITLTSWVKNYIFRPQIKLKNFLGNKYVCILSATCFTGIWHGLNQYYLIWGLGNFILYKLYNLIKPNDKLYKYLPKSLATIFCITLFFILNTLNGQIFYLQDKNLVLTAFQSIVHIMQSDLRIIYLCTILITPYLMQEAICYKYRKSPENLLFSLNTFVQAILFVSFFYAIMFFSVENINDHLYFRF